ncbi:MAG: helix-turn-helix transcriptional regulator [Clostridia bacterium]|nr:helix-turn-helix transcriptional regulator [Clostridia bacterium]
MSEQKTLFFEDLTNARSMSGHKHYHDVLELYFMERGSCRYFIDDKVYDVQEGDLILIPEGTLHKTVYGESDRARTLINCSRHYVPAEVAERLPALLHLYRNPSLVPRIRALLGEIRAEYLNPDGFSDAILTGWMHLLFYTLVRHGEERTPVGTEMSYIDRVLAFVKEHFAEEITLGRVAEQVGVSPAHLSRVFKRETGFGFSEYLTALRLQKAETMLRGGGKPRVTDVAFACGFNDSNYFCEKFKALYGFPPSTLKKRK